MKKKAEETPKAQLHSLHGVVFSAICAVAAEVILTSGLDPHTVVEIGADPSFAAVGRIAIVFLSVYTIHRFALESLKEYRPEPRDLITMLLVMLSSMVVVWLGRILSIGLIRYAETSEFFASVTPETLQFAIPYAAGALLLQAVLGLHFGLVFSVSFAIVVGIYAPGQPIVIPFVLATSLMACLSLSRFRTRSAYLKAGFNISIIAFPFALGSIVLAWGSTDTGELSLRLLAALLGALIGGGLCSFVAAGFTPVLESLGGYVTDMRLIEMGDIPRNYTFRIRPQACQ